MATVIINNPAPPRLPFDVQLVVAENCPDVPTLLALVSSHKMLRGRGARLALQLPTARVGLHTETALRSFFEFAAPLGRIEDRDWPSRLTHLHTLDISLGIVGAANIEALTTMLAHVPELTSLTIREPEAALADGPLYAALQRLTTLKSLHAFAAGHTTRKLFAEVASPLEDVTLTHNPAPSAALDDGALEVEKVVGRHRDTLTRVSASWALPFERANAQADTGPVVFENVRDLAIPGFFWDAAQDFVDAFPNIVSLDVGTSVTARWPLSPVLTRVRDANKYITGGTDDGENDDSESDSSDDEEEEDYERDSVGDSNEMGERDEVGAPLEMGERDGMGEGDEVGAHDQGGGDDTDDVGDEDENDDEPLAWESLERVRGGLLDLYVFGNSCAVDVLTIDGLIQDAWACVPAVVNDHCPRTLRLSVSCSLEVDAWERDWKKLGSVRHLALKIVAEDLFDDKQLTDTAVRAVTSFAFCRTVCLNLVGQSDAACRQLDGFNHEAFARWVFERSAATVKVCVHTPSRATFWHFGPPVVDGEGYAGVRPVLFEEAKLSAECPL